MHFTIDDNIAKMKEKNLNFGYNNKYSIFKKILFTSKQSQFLNNIIKG